MAELIFLDTDPHPHRSGTVKSLWNIVVDKYHSVTFEMAKRAGPWVYRSTAYGKVYNGTKRPSRQEIAYLFMTSDELPDFVFIKRNPSKWMPCP